MAFRKEELHSLAKEENVILYVEFPVEFEHGEQLYFFFGLKLLPLFCLLPRSWLTGEK